MPTLTVLGLVCSMHLAKCLAEGSSSLAVVVLLKNCEEIQQKMVVFLHKIRLKNLTSHSLIMSLVLNNKAQIHLWTALCHYKTPAERVWQFWNIILNFPLKTALWPHIWTTLIWFRWGVTTYAYTDLTAINPICAQKKKLSVCYLSTYSLPTAVNRNTHLCQNVL